MGRIAASSIQENMRTISFSFSPFLPLLCLNFLTLRFDTVLLYSARAETLRTKNWQQLQSALNSVKLYSYLCVVSNIRWSFLSLFVNLGLAICQFSISYYSYVQLFDDDDEDDVNVFVTSACGLINFLYFVNVNWFNWKTTTAVGKYYMCGTTSGTPILLWPPYRIE